MKKKSKNLFIAIVCLFAGSVVMAQKVNVEEARRAAMNFLTMKTQTINLKNAPVITATRAEEEDSETACYIFQLNNKGFIVVSAHKDVPAVLAYGENGAENLSNLNAGFEFWLRDIKKQITDVKKDKNKRTGDYSTEWRNLLSDIPLPHEKSGVPIVGPLTTSVWGQSGYYNDLTPPDGNTCPAGCVALGMSQAFKYYNHPVKGKNTVLSYLHKTTYGPENTALSYGTLTADLSHTTYNWANMPDTVKSPNPAVATLIYHAGVAVKMNYKPIPYSSSAYYSELANALKNVFGYTSSGALYRSSYTPQAWMNMIKEDLDNKRIVIMCGNDFTIGAGHCFVIDGYDDQNYLHINWGWNGSYNGYFLSTNVSVINYDFNGANHIYRLYPTCYSELSVNNITANSAVIKNTEYAETNYFQYRASGSPVWLTVPTIDSSVNITGLTPSTTYEYRDSIICSKYGKVVSTIKTFTTATALTYCPSSGKNIAYEWINSISVGSIANVSGKNNGYGDFTQLSTKTKTDTVNYTFTPGYTTSTYPERWIVWIDFNQDGDFTDSAEQVVSTIPVSGVLNGSFIIPSNARPGNTRMRIVMSYYAHSNPCVNPSYGEVEDYTITIITGQEKSVNIETEKPATSILKVYPNPTSGIVHLEIEGVKKNATLSVTNTLGQVFYTKEITPSDTRIDDSIDLSHLSNGIYIIYLNMNGKMITRHIIIE